MTERVRDYGSLGTWVRRRRKALDLTQAALAHRVGCAEVTIRKIETEAMRPSRLMSNRLARCLELSPDEQAIFLRAANSDGESTRASVLLAAADHSLPAAHHQPPLVQLPLDVLPLPAPLPRGSRMPLHRNPLFVGRDADLRQIARALMRKRKGTLRRCWRLRSARSAMNIPTCRGSCAISATFSLIEGSTRQLRTASNGR